MHIPSHRPMLCGCLTVQMVLPLTRLFLCFLLVLGADRFISAQGADAVDAGAAVQQSQAAPSTSTYGRVLDQVVAVVNNQVILQSDLDLEMRISHLLPLGDAADSTAPKALQRLITRTLIQQQIVQEDPRGLDIDPADLDSSLKELRQSLPACRVKDCANAAGWANYLAQFDLAPATLQAYWARRMAILRFIEQRFRSGIRITPEEIQHYYQTDLLPRFAKPADAPALERIAPRIQEILLQQQVNALLDEWLKSLQSQGQVEVLEPSLESPQIQTNPRSASLVDSPEGKGGSF